MSKTHAGKPVPLKQRLMLALLPALAAGWLLMHHDPDPKAQAEAQARAALAIEAAQYSCLKAAGLTPDPRGRAFTAAEAAALKKCRLN
jgi:hypothetical protein